MRDDHRRGVIRRGVIAYGRGVQWGCAWHRVGTTTACDEVQVNILCIVILSLDHLNFV
jgi:hypothetical protein